MKFKSSFVSHPLLSSLLFVFGFLGNFYFILTNASDTKCAELRSRENGFQDKSLVIGDYSILGNIADEYANSTRNWNVSGYWSVSSDCKLTTCQEAYLTAQCQTFGGTTPPPTTADQWQSASCKCNKQCTCSNEYLKPSVCARAYFQSNGCNVCGAPYTEFEDSSPIFPEAWTDKVASFLVKPGCTLDVYTAEDFEGESETIEGPFIETWSGTIMSYECQCNEEESDDHPLPTPTPRPSTNTVPIVQLPESMNQLVSQLRQRNYKHPGLLAAFSSLLHGRSSKNAYMLLIGSSGAGKSSAINNLMNNPNVTLEGVGESTTSEIHEFRMPIPVDEVGVSNSELRIIDTPGLGDTRGLENDALFLATLDEYLSQHEDLKTKIPNLVLIFHQFPDNRFSGEGAKFVKMVRGLSNLHSRITDENYSNVLFVFSHYCKESSRLLRRNPAPRLLQFKEVIEEYGLFPKPIFTSVIENKGKDNHLQMINGNYELPNMEYFPENLLNKFDKITLGGQDKMGRTIINSALGDRNQPKNFNMTETRFRLVSTSHPKVAKYLSILSSASTDLSKTLVESFNTMPSQLKTQSPNALTYLQKYFNVRNIRSKADLPQTTVAILELLENIEKDDAVSYLLENGLKLKTSAFPQKILTGYSFNVLRDSVLPLSPYKLDNPKSSPIGFQLPEAMICTKKSENFNLLQTFDTKKQYVRHRIQSFGINVDIVGNTDIFTGFNGKVKDGFFVKDVSCTNNVCTFVASRYFKLFQFDLNITAAQLNPDFQKRVTKLTAFDETSHKSIDLWSDFFNDYGTHMVETTWGGGRIDIHVTCPSTSVDGFKSRLFKTVEFAEDLNTLITGDKIDPERILPTGAKYSLIFHGGSPFYHASNLTALSLEDASKIMKNWKKSLRYNPVLFPIKIVPIHQAAQALGSQISDYIQEATSRLFNSSLIYVAPTPDPKVVEELARQQREQEEQLKKLAAEKKAKEEQAERDRLAEIEAKRLREVERQRLEAQRRREEAERLRKAEQDRQRVIREQREQREREAAAERQRQVQLAFQLMLNRMREEAQRAEIQRQIDEARRRRERASCLKQGTKILLVDFSEKPVEDLKIGDILLDKDLRPTLVLGVSYEFILTQKFYGFDNESFFFTDTHIFVGPTLNNGEPDNGDSFQLYTTSKASLFAQNPLLEYLNVKDFNDSNPSKSTTLLYFNPLTHTKPIERKIKVHLKPKTYPADTPIYFIQVDSPTGTYFAEGYVCRHEIPPLELWPNTMSVLFSLFGTNGFEILAKLPYSLETINIIDKISDEVQMRVKKVLDTEFLALLKNEASINHPEPIIEDEQNCTRKSFDSFNLDEVIDKIFNNPTTAALGMALYGGTGSIISKYLDNVNVSLTECQLRKLQDRLVNVITTQLELAMYK